MYFAEHISFNFELYARQLAAFDGKLVIKRKGGDKEHVVYDMTPTAGTFVITDDDGVCMTVYACSTCKGECTCDDEWFVPTHVKDVMRRLQDAAYLGGDLARLKEVESDIIQSIATPTRPATRLDQWVYPDRTELEYARLKSAKHRTSDKDPDAIYMIVKDAVNEYGIAVAVGYYINARCVDRVEIERWRLETIPSEEVEATLADYHTLMSVQ